jgi:hypothetical protein
MAEQKEIEKARIKKQNMVEEIRKSICKKETPDKEDLTALEISKTKKKPTAASLTYSDAGAFKTLLKKTGLYTGNKDKFDFNAAANKPRLDKSGLQGPGMTHRNIRISQNNM